MDSSDLDAAIVDRLQGDATLHALLPDGVYMDVAPPGAKRVVLVAIFGSEDTGTFGGRAIEAVTYAVWARALSTLQVDMKAAAARIDELLSDPPDGIEVPGYGYMACYRDELAPRIRHVEVDQIDASIQFLNRGGHYVLECARQ